MRKYRVYTESRVGNIVLFVSAIVLLVKSCGFIPNSFLLNNIESWFNNNIIVFFISLFLLYFSFSGLCTSSTSGKISIDNEKVTLHMLFRKKEYYYSDYSEIGLCTAVLMKRQDIWIYLSKTEMPNLQSVLYLNGLLEQRLVYPKYERDFILINYRSKVFYELLKCVPEGIKKKLIKDEQRLITGSSFIHDGGVLTYKGTLLNLRDSLQTNPNNMLSGKISPHFRNVRGVSIFFDVMMILFYFMILLFQKNYSPFDLLVMKIFSLIIPLFTVALIWVKMTNYLFGRYSFNCEKAEFQTMSKRSELRYEDCNDIRVMRWNRGSVPLVFICLTKNQLPDEDDRWLFVRPGGVSKRRGLPQYGKDFMMIEVHDVKEFKSFIGSVPERFRVKMMEDAERIFGDN